MRFRQVHFCGSRRSATEGAIRPRPPNGIHWPVRRDIDARFQDDVPPLDIGAAVNGQARARNIGCLRTSDERRHRRDIVDAAQRLSAMSAF